MITIDGSRGEGGGQVLRTSLSLAMITGEPLTIKNIRAGRKKPGLMRQHLTAVLAAAEICGGAATGADVGSTELEFRPGAVGHGDYHFAIGTAGSATLVLQTVLPALIAVPGRSRLVLEGGTHNPLAPPYDFLERSFLPLIARMGAEATSSLHRHGFYPAGGGRVSFEIGGGDLSPLSLPPRAGDASLKAVCLYSAITPVVAKREADVLASRLPQLAGRVEERRVDSAGPGNAVVVDAVYACEDGQTAADVFTAFGERGVSAEKVASGLAREVEEHLSARASVGVHLADQLLLPMALAGGGEFATTAPSRHTLTNIEVIQDFLPVRFAIRELGKGLHIVSCK